MKNKLFSQTIYCILFAFIYALSVIPMKVLYKISDFLFLIACEILRYRRQVVVQNISRAFPQKKYDEIHLIEQNFYRNFTDTFVEVIKSFSISSIKQNEKLEIRGFEFVKTQIEKENNVIACLGHCANWEMLNCLPAKIGVDVYTVYKPLKNIIINRIMLYIRGRFGMNLIPSSSITKHILSNKGKASFYLLIADQSPSSQNKKFQMNFLHQDTFIYPGPEKLAKATSSTVVYIKLIKTQRGHYLAECLPVCENANKIQSVEITKKYVELLEQNIQQDASCWLWTHKRWKK